MDKSQHLPKEIALAQEVPETACQEGKFPLSSYQDLKGSIKDMLEEFRPEQNKLIVNCARNLVKA